MFSTISSVFGVLAPLRGLSTWFIRLPWAAVFLFHGIQKFTNGIDGFAGMLSDFGPAAYPVAVAVAVGEILAGIGAIVGGFTKDDFGDAVTKLAGLAGFPIMLGAIFLVHWPTWSNSQGGMEFQVLQAGVAFWFMLKGKDA